MENLGISNLSLNLSSDSRPFHEKKRIKVTGNQRSRIKQRRAQKQEQKESDVGPSNVEVENRKRKLSKDNSILPRTSSSEHDRPVKSKKTNAVISSLFTKNPEIPTVESKKVTAVTEDVFTGKTFKDLQLHPFLVSNLEDKLGFSEMTLVQQLTIPVLLKGKDALVKSQTGSGKTLAYAVPIIQALQLNRVKIKRQDGPYALIIVPTRELALQSYAAFTKLLKTFIWIVPGCLMGGEKRTAEKSRLRKGVNVLVSTPGRLLDHIKNTKILDFTRLQWLIIDEADRLLELGYERDIAQILNAVKNDCQDPQTVLLSATLSQGVERLSSITLRNPENIHASDAGQDKHFSSVSLPHKVAHSNDEPALQVEKKETFAIPSKLQQSFLISPCKLRLVSLAALILWKCKHTTPASKMIVFMSTQDSVRFHFKLFTSILSSKKKTMDIQFGEDDIGFSDDEDDDSMDKNQLKMFQLHGDMVQKERTDTYHKFIEAKSGVLFCTDVAARGLDLPHVDWIVQHSLPGTTVDYIHRIGRTARAGTKGQSLLFLMPSEVEYVKILNSHKINLSELPLLKVLKDLLHHIDELLHLRTGNTARQLPRTVEEAATFLQDRFEEHVLKNSEFHEFAGKGFQSYIRAYATYSKEIKESLTERRLHLGHVAKSFALREPPSKVQQIPVMSFANKLRKKEKKEKKWTKPLSYKQAMLSESLSGIDSSSKTKMNFKQKQTFGKKKHLTQRKPHKFNK